MNEINIAVSAIIVILIGSYLALDLSLSPPIKPIVTHSKSAITAVAEPENQYLINGLSNLQIQSNNEKIY